MRVIHKIKSIKGKQYSCNDILTLLLPQIYDCIDNYGKHLISFQNLRTQEDYSLQEIHNRCRVVFLCS